MLPFLGETAPPGGPNAAARSAQTPDDLGGVLGEVARDVVQREAGEDRGRRLALQQEAQRLTNPIIAWRSS